MEPVGDAQRGSLAELTMCGIAGALTMSRNSIAPQAAARLTAALAHRGPDGEWFWADTDSSRRVTRERVPDDAGLVLGHRRLSIVDLASGDQPMANESGDVWVTFNGEIYNHLELRTSLEAAGHRFATRADTEVLVHGWEQWGEDLLPRLNGVFAFVLADRRRGVTLLARDPVGVKPLYLGVSNGLTWWASELNAAREAGLVTGPISAEALKLYFMFRFVPSPSSIFEGTWKIPPSHYVLLESRDAGREPTFRRYETRIRSSSSPRGRAEWREALMAELEAAVRRQLMSDVPVGSLLSGGLDSSVVTLMMKRHLPYLPHAFGIGFSSDGEGSEARIAGEAAGELGIPFTATVIHDNDYLAGWPAAFGQMDEPIANSGGLLVHLLCRTVSQSHKVVLSGQGADEPLGGYARHMAERLRRFGSLAPHVSAWVTERLVGDGAGNRLARILRAPDRDDRYLEILTVLEPEFVDRLVTVGAPARELGRRALATWLGQRESSDPLNGLLFVDARLSLADDLLITADHFSMRASVELRVPFLDLTFLELAERMPSRYKVSAVGERKWLYRQAAAPYLPRALAQRVCGLRARLGRKLGFTAPLTRWLEGAPGERVQPGAWVRDIPQMDLLAPSALAELNSRTGHASMTRATMVVYALSRWLRGCS